jgi:hypothetical protein
MSKEHKADDYFGDLFKDAGDHGVPHDLDGLEWHDEVYVPNAIDRILQGKLLGDSRTTSLQDLTDKGREANSLSGPFNAGQRVSFIANVGSVLTYDNVPGDGVDGTIIKIKSGAQKITAQGDLVFVQWDDGNFRPILAQHLRPGSSSKRMARNVAVRVADFSSLVGLFTPHVTSSADDELVHRATKDLWSFRQDEGGYVIERLFDYKGEPLKV